MVSGIYTVLEDYAPEKTYKINVQAKARSMLTLMKKGEKYRKKIAEFENQNNFSREHLQLNDDTKSEYNDQYSEIVNFIKLCKEKQRQS